MRAQSNKNATRLTAQGQAQILNGLIVACNDIARARSSASRVVDGADRRGDLDIGAGRSLGLAAELGRFVRALGLSPARGGSLLESVRAALHQINATIYGENADDAYALCDRVEERAKKLYETASRAALPAQTKTVILRHLAEDLGWVSAAAPGNRRPDTIPARARTRST
jgi:uncharacterized protein (TIGR02284 family)